MTDAKNCGICARDLSEGHDDSCTRHPNNSAITAPCEGYAVINGHRYRKPVMRVARMTLDGATCVVAASELMRMLGDGRAYTVRMETMRVAEFERMEEFSGW